MRLRGGGLIGAVTTPSSSAAPGVWSMADVLAARRAGTWPNAVSWESFTAGLSASQMLDIDFSKTDRHFQEAGGITLADDPNENIGLALDSASWGGRTLADEIVAGPELIGSAPVNGTTHSFSPFTTSGKDITRAVKNPAGFAGATWDLGAAFPANTIIAAGVTIAVNAGGSPQLRFVNSNNGSGAGGSAIRSSASGYALFPFNSSGQYLQLGGSSDLFDFSAVNPSAKRVLGNAGSQATANLQGKRQAGGVCRYDGSDDNHLTPFLAQNGAMTVYARAAIAASLGAVQVLIGASGSGANRIWLGVDTAGHLCAGVGSNTNTVIVGTTDVRGKTIDACLSTDGTTVKLFLRVDGAVTQEYSGAQNGTPTTTIPFRLGANNNNGTAGSYAAIDVARFRAAHKAMTIVEFTLISAAA